MTQVSAELYCASPSHSGYGRLAKDCPQCGATEHTHLVRKTLDDAASLAEWCLAGVTGRSPTPEPFRPPFGNDALRTIMRLPQADLREPGVIAAIARLQQTHYPRQMSNWSERHRTEHHIEGSLACTDDCLVDFTICNGCGSARCKELPILEALLAEVRSG